MAKTQTRSASGTVLDLLEESLVPVTARQAAGSIHPAWLKQDSGEALAAAEKLLEGLALEGKARRVQLPTGTAYEAAESSVKKLVAQCTQRVTEDLSLQLGDALRNARGEARAEILRAALANRWGQNWFDLNASGAADCDGLVFKGRTHPMSPEQTFARLEWAELGALVVLSRKQPPPCTVEQPQNTTPTASGPVVADSPPPAKKRKQKELPAMAEVKEATKRDKANQPKPEGKMRSIPVTFRGVSLGENTLRIGVEIGREFLQLKDADELLNWRRLVGSICRGGEHETAEQLMLVQDIQHKITGAFDVKGFRVNGEKYACALTFTADDSLLVEARHFRKKGGRIDIAETQELDAVADDDDGEDDE